VLQIGFGNVVGDCIIRNESQVIPDPPLQIEAERFAEILEEMLVKTAHVARYVARVRVFVPTNRSADD
jgi:hypothetical protein